MSKPLWSKRWLLLLHEYQKYVERDQSLYVGLDVAMMELDTGLVVSRKFKGRD